MMTVTPSPFSAARHHRTGGGVLVLGNLISLMLGADDSRSADPPVGDAMPRPTPNWKEFSSIQPTHTL